MDIDKFKKDFRGISQPAMIDYIYKNKQCLKEDLLNIGIKSRIERKKFACPHDLKRTIKYLLTIKFITEEEDHYKLNNNFTPKNQ